MVLCLKGLEERKGQEAGSRRSVEEAANDLKVKWDLLLHWMVISEGQFAFSVAIQTPRQLLLFRKSVFPIPLATYYHERERRGKSKSQKIWPSLCNELNISGRATLKFLCGGRVNSPSLICYWGFTDVWYIALNCIIE